MMSAMLSVALSQSRNLEEYDAIYREAIKFEPDYYYYARQKAIFLLPRWHGEDGAWEAFVKRTSNEIGGAKGAIIYYLVVSEFIGNFADVPFYKSRLSIDKAKRGFYELKKAYGAEKQRLNEFAHFAVKVNDLLAAREAFEEIGDDWLIDTWQSKEAFDASRQAAAEARKNYDKKEKFRNSI
jgi:hypothetical protein